MQLQLLLEYGDENSRVEKSGENLVSSSAVKMLLNHLVLLAAVHKERMCTSGS